MEELLADVMRRRTHARRLQNWAEEERLWDFQREVVRAIQTRMEKEDWPRRVEGCMQFILDYAESATAGFTLSQLCKAAVKQGGFDIPITTLRYRAQNSLRRLKAEGALMLGEHKRWFSV